MLIVVALAWTMTLREIAIRISTSLVLIACAIGIAFGGAAWIGRGDRTIGLYETCRSTGDREFCPWLCDYCTGDCDRCSGKWMCGLSG